MAWREQHEGSRRPVRSILETVRQASRHERGAVYPDAADRPVNPEGHLAIEDQEELIFGGVCVQRRPAARRLRGDEGEVGVAGVGSARDDVVDAAPRAEAPCRQVDGIPVAFIVRVLSDAASAQGKRMKRGECDLEDSCGAVDDQAESCVSDTPYTRRTQRVR